MAIRALSRRESTVPDIFDWRRNVVDDLFSRMWSAPLWGASMAMNPDVAWVPPVESYIDQNRFVVRLALPGVKPSEVNVQAHDSELTVSGERKQEITPSDERSFRREIVYGSFERVIPLPEGVQADKIEANFYQGVLEVSAPLSEKALPRKIEVKGGEGRKLAA